MNINTINEKIINVEGIILSSTYGTGKTLGQPKGVKSLGFIQLTSESQQTGLGETYAGVYVPELIPQTVEFLKDMIIGKSISDVDIIKNITEIPFIGRNGLVQSIASAVDIALWDLRGKILGQPVYKILSDQYSKQVEVYASSRSTSLSPQEIKDDAKKLKKEGYNAYKMRVGFQDWNTDLERVKAAREIFNNGEKLMVDAIMGTLRPTWSVKEAISRAKDLEKFNLEWLEEPLFPDNISGLAELKESSNVIIAAGEAYSGLSEFNHILSINAVDILQFDATHSGGISTCLDLSDVCKEKNIRTAVHVWGSAVAIASNAHLALSKSNIEILEIPMVPLEITEKMWIESPTIQSGQWIANDLPGLGIELTDEIKDKYKFVPKSGYKLPEK